MKIINPLYDQAFKYLMDNEQIAKKVMSIILEQDVISIQSKPVETKLLDKRRDIPLSRFDYKAIILTPDGKQKNVLIEVQKSKNPDPIVRFRRYLGKNYIRQETYIDEHGREITAPLPIITVYILGYKLAEYDTPGLLINNQVIDAVTKNVINYKNEFIELLTHPSYILQVERLKPVRKSKLEKFLSMFDQHCKTDDDFILDINDDDIIEFDDIANHLNRATQDEEMIRKLEYEEDIEQGYDKLEKDLESSKLKIEEKEKTIEEKEKTIEEKEKTIEENKNELKEKEKTIKEKEKTIKEAKIKLARKMKKYGEPNDEIIKETGLSMHEIESL